MNISPQQKQSSLIGAGNKGDCFIVDLLTSQLEKEILKKGEIIIFLSVKNVNTSGISTNFFAQSQK